MRYRFITIVHNLILPEENQTLKLKQGCLSNNPEILAETLDNELTLSTLGLHSKDEFEGTTFFFIDGEFDKDFTLAKINLFGTKLTFAFLRVIQSYVFDLWRIKDNAIYIRDGFLYSYVHNISDGYTFKASLSAVISQSNGFIEPIRFSEEELISASSEMSVVDDTQINPEIEDYKNVTQDHFFKQNKPKKFDRAWGYIIIARSSSMIPIKITIYTMALECLLGTTNVELSHRLSERSAILLGSNPEQRLAVYENVKKTYGIRSSIAHGVELKDKLEDLLSLSQIIDGYIRNLLSYEEIYNKENNEINSYFDKKIMGLI